MSKYCSRCGRPARDDAAFCEGCGTPFAQPGAAFPDSNAQNNQNNQNKQKKLLIGIAAGGGGVILILLAVVAVLLLRGGNGGGVPPVSTGSAAPPGSSTRVPVVSASSSSAALPEVQFYDMYTQYDATVGRDQGRTLVAPGWTLYQESNWEFQSVVEPVTLKTVAMSPDGQAGIFSRSGARFMDAENAGLMNLPDPNSVLGLPRRGRPSAQQLLEEYIPTMYGGISNLQISSYGLVDDNGILMDHFELTMEEDRRNLEAQGHRIENMYCEYGRAAGTVVVDGQPKEFEAYIELEGYDGVMSVSGGQVRLVVSGMSGITVIFAPSGQMGEYISDMALILRNSQTNGYWLDLRRGVGENLQAKVNSGELSHWEDAWLYADEAIASAAAGVPDAQDYTSHRAERVPLEGFALGAWETQLPRYRYISPAGDVFLLDREWAGVWYDGGTSLLTCAEPGHVPEEAAGYMQLTPESA